MKFKPFSKKSKKSDSPPEVGPYEGASAVSDPYLNNNYRSDPPPYTNGGSYTNGGQDHYRREKSPAVTGPGASYGNGNVNGYGNGNANGNGAGIDRHQPYGSAQENGGVESRRPGGYGGFDRTNSNDTMTTDAGREKLFSNAPQRNQTSQRTGNYAQNGNYSQSTNYGQDRADPNRNGLFGDAQQRHQQNGGYARNGASRANDDYGNGGYGGYDSTNMTAEEVDEVVQGIKQETKDTRRATHATTQGMRGLMGNIKEIGNNTLGSLARQGEMMGNAELHIDAATAQSKIAERNTKELYKTNKSAFHINGSRKDHDEADRELMRERQQQRDQRAMVKEETYRRHAETQEIQKTMGQRSRGTVKSGLAINSQYVFEESDEEDLQIETEIGGDLEFLKDELGDAKAIGMAISKEIDEQNKRLVRLQGKTDTLDNRVTDTTAKLSHIH